MPALPTGNALTSCLPYVVLTWTVPFVAVLAGIPVNTAALLASLVASVQESLIWGCRRNKGLRRHAGVLHWFPIPARLGVLWTFQLFFTDVLLEGGLLGAHEAGPGKLSGRAAPGGANGLRPWSAMASGAAEEAARGPPPPAQHLYGGPSAAAGVAKEAAEMPASDDEPAAGAGGTGPVGTDLEGQPFYVDAEPSTLSWNPKTISVILPCAEEREYALKTVKSIFDQTPSEVLHEIIVVDDGSEPPLSTTHLKPDVQARYKLKVLRHPKTVGLIGAKKTGGDAATGDLSIFFDCHVAPQPGWHKAFLRLIGENYRRLVVPQITSLDVGSWTQIGSGGGMAKCYLTWDADFKWFESIDPYVAVISGGFLGMSRRWWLETGGYDVKMLGWGGENIDQSLRMWLCGGEIMAADDSFVAHMWRTEDTRTASHYIHVGDVDTNRARAAYAWFGDFKVKLQEYPQFSRRVDSSDGTPWYGSLNNIFAVRDRLSCRPFAWFLRRFKAIYEDGGLIPERVFMLREERTGRCLEYEGQAGTSFTGSGRAVLASCDALDNKRLYWHLGNKKRQDGICCSGMRAWNTDQCLQDVEGGRFQTGICDVSGHNFQQQWALSGQNELRQRTHCAGTDNGVLDKRPCIAMRSAGYAWSILNAYKPPETVLYEKARAERPDVFAHVDRQLANTGKTGVAKACGGAPEGCVHLLRPGASATECLDDSMQFTEDSGTCAIFFFENGAIHTMAERNTCVDTWSDNNKETYALYTCHNGATQLFTDEKSSLSFCNEVEKECLTYRRVTDLNEVYAELHMGR